MGAVYLAVREEAYYAEVAIKLLKGNSDPDLLQRFRGERRAEDDQGSGPQRDLALIQSTLGEHFAALGAHAPGGRDMLRRARTWYERSRRVWWRLQERGILREADQANLASVNEELARLRDQAVSR